ncbi:MAG: hypothetical protein AB7N80_12020, partial [Bdellovibrionales bacterium]
MKRLYGVGFAALLVFSFGSVRAFADAAVSCECPKLDCGPCKEEQGLTFYSEKCGPGGQQVKSCARPTCVALENPPPSCAEKARTPASLDQIYLVLATHSRGEQIGQIKGVEGKAW